MPIRVLAQLLFTVWCAAAPLAAAAIDPGTKAPDFTLPTLSGGSISLSQHHGKVIYLDFWASWCVPCKHSLPWMEELRGKFGPQGLEVIAINIDSDKVAAGEALSSVHPSFAVGLDPEMKVVGAYAPPSMPSSYLIDRSGTVVMVHSGFHESERPALEEQISNLLKK